MEKTALELAKTDPKLMTRYLTDYSVTHVEQTTAQWQTLAEYLFTKYRDGYVYNGKSEWKEVGYPEAWLRRVVREAQSNSASPQKSRPRRNEAGARSLPLTLKEATMTKGSALLAIAIGAWTL